MAGPDETRVYDPDKYARGGTRAESEDGGIGSIAEKNPTATLRIFGSNLGDQWLMYHGVFGGRQDYKLEGVAPSHKTRCNWFVFYYHGAIERDGAEYFGRWKVTVVGKSLELTCRTIAAQTRGVLRVGQRQSSSGDEAITSIEIQPMKLKRLKSDDDDDMDDEE